MYKTSAFKHFLLIILSILVVSCGGGGSTGGGSVSGGGATTTATGVYILSWDAVMDPAVTAYRVYYATSPLSSGKLLGQFDTSATSLEFSAAVYGITAGTTLYMAVSALGANGLESPASSQVSIIAQ